MYTSMLLKNQHASLAKRLKYYVDSDAAFKKVFVAVKKNFDASGLTAHNWEHIWRDTLNAIVIGEAEKADMSIVLPAIVMHDIGFLYGGTGKTHGAIGADKLKGYLKKIKVTYPQAAVEHIAACIRTHKGSSHGENPETLEAKVVADADLLEKFGLFGVYQYIRTFTEFNRGIERVIQRKDEMKGLYLQTKTGKNLAEKGRKFVVDFFSRLDEAYEPYKE